MKPEGSLPHHKCPPPVPILIRLDPVHTPHPTSWRSILILSSHLRLGLPSGLFPLRLTPLIAELNLICHLLALLGTHHFLHVSRKRVKHQNPVRASPLPHKRYMPRESHSSRFYHPNSIGWAVQNIKLLIMQFPPLPCYIVPPRPNLPLTLILTYEVEETQRWQQHTTVRTTTVGSITNKLSLIRSFVTSSSSIMKRMNVSTSYRLATPSAYTVSVLR